jgi:phosphatidate phosphatase APP1
MLDAHGLFDAVICKLPPDLARPLWNRWMCHEYECHDLKTVQKLHRRMTEVFPSGMFLTINDERHLFEHLSQTLQFSNLPNDTPTTEQISLLTGILDWLWLENILILLIVVI